MENHPIPQDITGFQFKLIGDMTVKQFVYIAVGVIMGWVFYILPLPFLIKLPFSIIFIATGVGLAFVPIGGRPMDTMIGYFFKAVFSPTQYAYQKQGAKLWADSNKKPSAKTLTGEQYGNSPNNHPKNKLDKKESVFFQSLNSYSTPQQNVPNPTVIPSHYYALQGQGEQNKNAAMPGSGQQQNNPNVMESQDLLKAAAILEKEIAQAKATEQKQNQVDPKAFSETHQKVLELQKQLSDMLSQKEELEKKLIEIQKNMGASSGPVFSPSVATQAPSTETKFVRSIPQNMTQSVGLPNTPEFPNLLTGIIKDPRGNPLANILVEVKDDEGNAVRAFKTNALGQFASATPLNNGKYTVNFDDPKAQNRFDTVAFDAKGEIILPIEVISVDQREELRRSLFN
jgi:hypothetical protein